jgi:flagellar hook-length control protein FliK
MLNQQGIELGQSSVQQDQQQQNGEQQQGQFAEGKADDGMDEIAGEVIEQRVINGSAGGIDFYA